MSSSEGRSDKHWKCMEHQSNMNIGVNWWPSTRIDEHRWKSREVNGKQGKIMQLNQQVMKTICVNQQDTTSNNKTHHECITTSSGVERDSANINGHIWNIMKIDLICDSQGISNKHPSNWRNFLVLPCLSLLSAFVCMYVFMCFLCVWVLASLPSSIYSCLAPSSNMLPWLVPRPSFF